MTSTTRTAPTSPATLPDQDHLTPTRCTQCGEWHQQQELLEGVCGECLDRRADDEAHAAADRAAVAPLLEQAPAALRPLLEQDLAACLAEGLSGRDWAEGLTRYLAQCDAPTPLAWYLAESWGLGPDGRLSTSQPGGDYEAAAAQFAALATPATPTTTVAPTTTTTTTVAPRSTTMSKTRTTPAASPLHPAKPQHTIPAVVSALRDATLAVQRAGTYLSAVCITAHHGALGAWVGNLEQAAVQFAGHADRLEREAKAEADAAARRAPAGLADCVTYRKATPEQRLLLEADMARCVQQGLTPRQYLECLAEYTAEEYVATLDAAYVERCKADVMARVAAMSSPAQPITGGGLARLILDTVAPRGAVQLPAAPVATAANTATPAPAPVLTQPTPTARPDIPADWTGMSKQDTLDLFVAVFGHQPSWAGHGMSTWRRSLECVRDGRPLPYGLRLPGTAKPAAVAQPAPAPKQPAAPAPVVAKQPEAPKPAPVATKPATPAPVAAKPAAPAADAKRVAVQAALSGRTLDALCKAVALVGGLGLKDEQLRSGKAMETALAGWLKDATAVPAADPNYVAPTMQEIAKLASQAGGRALAAANKPAEQPATLGPVGPLTHKQCMQLGKARLEALATKLGVEIPDMRLLGSMAQLAKHVSLATQPADETTLYVLAEGTPADGVFETATDAQIEAAYRAMLARKAAAKKAS